MVDRSRSTRLGLLLACSLLAGMIVAGLALPVVGGLGLAVRTGVRSFEALPTDLQVPQLPQRSTIVAADGSPIGDFFLEDRVAVSFDQIAPIMRKAIVAIEDSRFYSHGALDIKGTLRALVTNASAGSIQQGGSTLTQQYVKNVLVQEAVLSGQGAAGVANATKDTLGRKLREARYAVALEQHLTKDQILGRYLNIVYFGDGAYGVGAAARHYFSETAAQLTLPQAALLAGVVEDPSAYDPVLHPANAVQRRNIVLDRMAQLNLISAATADAAKASPLGLHVRPQPNGCAVSADPFFCEYVLTEIQRMPTLGATPAQRTRLLLDGGLTVHTTLVPKVQAAAMNAISALAPGSSGYGAAEALVQPGTGDIQALAVNLPYGSGKGQTTLDLAADADHGGSNGFQSGSTFKIFTLAAALSQGIGPSFTQYAPPLLVNPGGFRTCNGSVLNYGGKNVGNASASDAGTYNLAQATWNSINTFFIKLEEKVGLCAPLHMAEAAGMRLADGQPIVAYPSFTLGVYDVSPLTLANAYATFAASGMYCPPVAITSITTASGKTLPLPAHSCHQAVDPTVAHDVSAILQGVIKQGTGTAAQIGRPAAGKTGTVESFTAAWFCGYVPQLASCVWFGFPNGGESQSLTNVTVNGIYYPQVYGASIPAPIWGRTMSAALQGVPVQQFPAPVFPGPPPAPAAPTPTTSAAASGSPAPSPSGSAPGGTPIGTQSSTTPPAPAPAPAPKKKH